MLFRTIFSSNFDASVLNEVFVIYTCTDVQTGNIRLVLENRVMYEILVTKRKQLYKRIFKTLQQEFVA